MGASGADRPPTPVTPQYPLKSADADKSVRAPLERRDFAAHQFVRRVEELRQKEI